MTLGRIATATDYRALNDTSSNTAVPAKTTATKPPSPKLLPNDSVRGFPLGTVWWLYSGAVRKSHLINVVPHGPGTLTSHARSCTYSGEFQAGRLPFGSCTELSSKATYTGPFNCTAASAFSEPTILKHGEGVLTLNTGMRFKVTYENGELIESTPLDAA